MVHEDETTEKTMEIYEYQLKHGPEGRTAEKTETVNGKAMT